MTRKTHFNHAYQFRIWSGCAWNWTRGGGRLLMVVKSAHVYESERTYVRDVLEAYR